MRILWLALILAAAMPAADIDVAGRWSGTTLLPTPDGQTREGAALLVLKQSGAAVTGTAGPNEDQQMAISEGKVESGKLSFRVQSENVDLNFVLTVAGERMAGEANGTLNGQSIKVMIEVTRAKS
jgi:hypothetical protein